MSKLLDFISGGMGSEIVKGVASFVKGQFPDKLSEADQLQIQMKVTEIANAQINKAAELAGAETVEFNDRIKLMEGTASDLKAIPVMLFLRGAQRPVWSMATMYFDWIWFNGSAFTEQQSTALIVINRSAFTEQQSTALIVINSMVLGILFGERTLKNLEPLLIKVFAK